MISTIICALTIKQIGISCVFIGVFFIAGALGLYLLDEDDKAEPNRAEERLRAKLKVDQAESKLTDHKLN